MLRNRKEPTEDLTKYGIIGIEHFDVSLVIYYLCQFFYSQDCPSLNKNHDLNSTTRRVTCHGLNEPSQSDYFILLQNSSQRDVKILILKFKKNHQLIILILFI